MLRGKETEKVQQHGHQRIKTYGVGTELDDTQWRSVFRQVVARGYLQVDVAGYGALQLTARSRPLLRGEESIALRRDLPEKAAPRPRRERRERQLAAGDQALFEALRQCRLSIAQEQDVPAYVIFHDATLMDMASSRPLDAAQLLAINGVGRRKLEQYGAAFLDVIREFDAAPAAAGLGAERVMTVRSNLLVIFGDQHRGEALGCAGNPDVQTPALDRLAAEGVRFTHAYANTPVCTPSRGSLLTGQWPHRHRALSNDLPLDAGPHTPAIARSLRAADYRCGYIGKWHIGGWPRDRFHPAGTGTARFRRLSGPPGAAPTATSSRGTT